MALGSPPQLKVELQATELPPPPPPPETLLLLLSSTQFEPPGMAPQASFWTSYAPEVMGLYCSQVWAAAARRRGRNGADRDGEMVVRRERSERCLYMMV